MGVNAGHESSFQRAPAALKLNVLSDTKDEMNRHHPLRIPAGWTICQNHFLEIEPEEASLENGRLDFPFYEDMLHLRNADLRMVLDLGWYPDGDPNGTYRLCLIQWDAPPNHNQMPKRSITIKRNGVTYTYLLEPQQIGDAWSKPLIEFESRDANEIRQRIDDVLDAVVQGRIGKT